MIVLEILELKDLNDVLKLFYGFDLIKPKVGDFIRIKPLKKDPPSELNYIYNNVSFDKVYEVFKVVNQYEVSIRSNKRFTLNLTKSFYQVVEETTEKQIKADENTQVVLKSLDKVLKKQREK